jgi:hypothetical protein
VPVSTLAIVLIAIAVVVLALVVGGLVIYRRRVDRPEWAEHVAIADAALEQARALDRGWDRALMEAAVRRALAELRPDWRYDDLHLVLVDDRPGVTGDTAHFVAIGPDGEGRIVLARGEQGWAALRVD